MIWWYVLSVAVLAAGATAALQRDLAQKRLRERRRAVLSCYTLTRTPRYLPRHRA